MYIRTQYIFAKAVRQFTVSNVKVFGADQRYTPFVSAVPVGLELINDLLGGKSFGNNSSCTPYRHNNEMRMKSNQNKQRDKQSDEQFPMLHLFLLTYHRAKLCGKTTLTPQD